jgi:hypothetical protein
MALDNLAAILYDESFLVQFFVSSYIIGAIIFLNLVRPLQPRLNRTFADTTLFDKMMYVFRIVLMLCAIEQPWEQLLAPMVGPDDVCLLNLGFTRDIDGQFDMRQQRLFQGRRTSKWNTWLKRTRKRILPLRVVAWHSSEDASEVVTRSLVATIRQLRYYSGSSPFFTRGLFLYIIWYHILPTILELAMLFVLGLLALILQFVLWTVGKGDAMKSLPASMILMGLHLLVKGAYFAFASEHIAFHTM